jgi:predicted nucleic acid-binding protein
MLVVADTSPLRYLVVIQAIEILPLLYERVIVPQAVLTELQHPRSPREVRAWLATPPAWVEMRQPQQRTRLARLGPGEQDAIQLAEELHADLVLMDDEDGRIEAERRAMAVIGTLGVLERAAERGLLDLPSALTRLRATNFFVDDALIEEALARDATRKRPM